jgi:hypothetical protein
MTDPDWDGAKWMFYTEKDMNSWLTLRWKARMFTALFGLPWLYGLAELCMLNGRKDLLCIYIVIGVSSIIYVNWKIMRLQSKIPVKQPPNANVRR